MSTPVNVVLFHLDDTLVDHQYALNQGIEAVQQAFQSLRAQPLELLQEDYRRMTDEIWRRVVQGQMTPEESQNERVRRLFVQYGEAHDAGQVARAGTYYRAAYECAKRPVVGAASLLQYLQGRAQVGIVTNNLTAHQHDKLRFCQIDHLIDFMITAEDTGLTKPAPAMFAVALQRANCTPGEAVMIGDSWQADVLGARAAGIRAIWLNRLGEACPDPASAVEIASLEPVEAVIDLIFGSAA